MFQSSEKKVVRLVFYKTLERTVFIEDENGDIKTLLEAYRYYKKYEEL